VEDVTGSGRRRRNRDVERVVSPSLAVAVQSRLETVEYLKEDRKVEWSEKLVEDLLGRLKLFVQLIDPTQSSLSRNGDCCLLRFRSCNWS
jgi:hypothetical protein